jgi:hypothetical protein
MGISPNETFIPMLYTIILSRLFDLFQNHSEIAQPPRQEIDSIHQSTLLSICMICLDIFPLATTIIARSSGLPILTLQARRRRFRIFGSQTRYPPPAHQLPAVSHSWYSSSIGSWRHPVVLPDGIRIINPLLKRAMGSHGVITEGF